MSQTKKLIDYLDGLRKDASNTEAHVAFEKYNKYYEGKVRPQIGLDFKNDPKMGNTSNSYNCIKPIVETKATIALDVQVSTSVKPASLSHANYEYINEIESISDILNDVWDSVKIRNNISDVHQRIVRDGLIYGVGIGKASWDQSADNGLGNVSITRVSPLDFFPEPQATSIENANYIFLRRRLSKFDLINQYKDNPKVMKILDELDQSTNTEIHKGAETDILQGYENTKDSGQAYLREGGILPTGTTTNYNVYECYLKDDTVFVESKDDNSDTKQVKKENVFKYPNGRLIVYCGKHILEDRPIDYPFGFPFSTFNPTNTNKIFGASDVADLVSTQDKLTSAYYKLSELIAKYKSMLLVAPDTLNPADLAKNFDIITTKRGAVTPPQLITNKLTDDIQIIRQHISDLKQDALSLARINQVMLSGERPVGANSGQMIRDLIESPMSSIREIQRNFKKFLIDITNKGLVLIQLYYNQPRVMRLSGERIAMINQGSDMLEIRSETEDPQLLPMKLINDLSLTQYEVEVQTGSALPQSQSAIAATTMQLAKDGILGDINSIDTREMILKSLDYPNYRAIIQKQKEEQEQISQAPIEPKFEDYLKNISMNLGDILDLIGTLSPQQQSQAVYSISDALGITQGNPDLKNEMPDMGNEGIELSFN